MSEQAKEIDWTKPVEYMYSGGSFPVVASFPQPGGDRLIIVRDDDGRHMDFSLLAWQYRFRNVRRKVKRKAWLNLYKVSCGPGHSSRNVADQMANNDRVECRLIEWEVEVDD